MMAGLPMSFRAWPLSPRARGVVFIGSAAHETRRVVFSGGTLNRGRNAAKRRQRAAIAKLRGAPWGGWKKALRQLQAAERARPSRQVPPHRSGGGQ
jgi:hypothetical protein